MVSAAGSWGHTAPPDDATRSGAFDISIQRSLGRKWPDTSEPAIRLQVGRGNSYKSGEGDFHYRRVMLGAVHEYSIIFRRRRRPFYVHLAAGAGAYRVSSAGKSETKSSLFAEAGFDVRLGSSPLTLGPEVQLHTIGDLLYGTTSIVARIRLP